MWLLWGHIWPKENKTLLWKMKTRYGVLVGSYLLLCSNSSLHSVYLLPSLPCSVSMSKSNPFHHHWPHESVAKMSTGCMGTSGCQRFAVWSRGLGCRQEPIVVKSCQTLQICLQRRHFLLLLLRLDQWAERTCHHVKKSKSKRDSDSGALP